MKRGRRSLHIVALLVLLAPLAVTSTPPSIPWDVFEVAGTLIRAVGSPADHTVVLVRRDYCNGVKQWCRLINCDIEEASAYGPFVPMTLTAADGRFSLRVAVCNSYWLDTLAVAVVYPDTMLAGDSFIPGDLESTPITATRPPR
jgi:hypothetical protein